MGENRKRILIAAGGTGGHILPGIRVGKQIEERFGGDYTVDYVCGSRAIEGQIYESEGVSPMKLRLGSQARGVPLMGLLTDFFTVVSNYTTTRPAAVLAMGGAACFPVLAASALFRVPIFLHESNRIPGRVVRLFAPFARKVFLGLGGLDRKNAQVTGTPTRRPPDADGVRDTVLCVGGSQGATRLNELFITAANRDHIRKLGYRFVLISGPGKPIPNPGVVEVREYEPRMESLLCRTQLIVSRAGAGALADIANFRIPSILVPYPLAKDDHQKANAQVFSTANAAFLMEEKLLTPESLTMMMYNLLVDEGTRGEMKARLAEFDSSASADVVARAIIESLSSDGRHPAAIPANARISHEHH